MLHKQLLSPTLRAQGLLTSGAADVQRCTQYVGIRAAFFPPQSFSPELGAAVICFFFASAFCSDFPVGCRAISLPEQKAP